MQIRNGFVSNSSSSSFVVNNRQESAEAINEYVFPDAEPEINCLTCAEIETFEDKEISRFDLMDLE